MSQLIELVIPDRCQSCGAECPNPFCLMRRYRSGAWDPLCELCTLALVLCAWRDLGVVPESR